MPKRRIRILLVDDHPVVREGLRSILGTFDVLSIVGEAGNGAEAIAAAQKHLPDVILMDINLPDLNGIEVTTQITRQMPNCKVLALSMHDNRNYVTQILRAGARGYILKDCSPSELCRAICDVHEGLTAMSPRAAEALVRESFSRLGEPKLSPRERDVLQFISHGLTNKEISSKLNVSVRTVESHREHLTRKLGRSSVAELTRYAVTKGYVDLHPVK